MSNEPSFAVILPTYKRPELVKKAVESVIRQTISSWKLIVIQDSPDEKYQEVEDLMSRDVRCVYLTHNRNRGKNACLNTAFTYLYTTGFDGYVVFLDDDDWLDKRCLEDFNEIIKKQQVHSWFVSARSIQNNFFVTKNQTGRNSINYIKDCLVFKRFTGDATHCVKFSTIEPTYFPKSIRNGEEWIYFSELSLKIPSFFFIEKTGTWSNGYLEDGLTKQKSTKLERFRLYMQIVKELRLKKLLRFWILIYLFLRFGKLLFR